MQSVLSFTWGIKRGSTAITDVLSIYRFLTTLSFSDMKCGLDKTVNSLDPAACTTTDTSKVTLESSSVSTKAHKPKAPLSKPSAKELDAFYKSLSECKIKPVCLSLEKPYADIFITKTRNISTYADLSDPKFLQLNYIDLLKECYKVEFSISPEDIALP